MDDPSRDEPPGYFRPTSPWVCGHDIGCRRGPTTSRRERPIYRSVITRALPRSMLSFSTKRNALSAIAVPPLSHAPRGGSTCGRSTIECRKRHRTG